MNYINLINQSIKEIQNSIKNGEDKIEKLNKAKEKTTDFLNACSTVGIKTVSICKQTDLIKESKSFPFGVGSSVFAEGRYEGWPAIWRACEISGVGCGAGNHDEHQVNSEMLIEGVYQLKNKKWHLLSTEKA